MSEQQYSFSEAFCRVHQCKPEDFVPRVFHLCLHGRVRMLVRLIENIVPGLFTADVELLKEAAKAKDAEELMAKIQMYQHNCRRNRTFFHDTLGLRVSCGRVIRLFDQVMAAPDKLGNGAAPSPFQPSGRP